jgi:hypothetical protein
MLCCVVLHCAALHSVVLSAWRRVDYVPTMLLFAVVGTAAFLPIFEARLGRTFMPLLNEESPPVLYWNALCVFVDVIEVRPCGVLLQQWLAAHVFIWRCVALLSRAVVRPRGSLQVPADAAAAARAWHAERGERGDARTLCGCGACGVT